MHARYNLSLSTEENYQSVENVYVGKFAEFRQQVDHSYHRCYIPERQLLQDSILERFTLTIVRDSNTCAICEVPDQNWLVFTAGTMGAGKTHTLNWLNDNGMFPLDSFVRVDPDELRALLPEMKSYVENDPKTAGKLTQKEVGYMSELLTLYALREGKNVLVDGSLRNAEWHKVYIQSVRDQYPDIRIGIVHVVAPLETVVARCIRREKITGRHVPQELVVASMEQHPISIRKLAASVDVVITLLNEDTPPEDSITAHPQVVDSPTLSLFRTANEPLPLSLRKAPQNLPALQRLFEMTCSRPSSAILKTPSTDSTSEFGLSVSPASKDRLSDAMVRNCALGIALESDQVNLQSEDSDCLDS